MGSAVLSDELIVFSGLPGEGNNGQTVRIAIAVSAITLIPVQIEDIRDNKKTPGQSHSIMLPRTLFTPCAL